MGEEDRNSENIRKESKELSYIRKEQQRIKLWGGVLLGANLLLLAGFLWVSSWNQETKQPVPEETDFQYPPPVPPAEEDTCFWVAEEISDEVSNADTTDETEDTNNAEDTEESLYKLNLYHHPHMFQLVRKLLVRKLSVRPLQGLSKKSCSPGVKRKRLSFRPLSLHDRG